MTRRLRCRVAAAGVALAVLAACDRQPVSADRQTGTAPDSAEQVLYNASTVLTANGVRRGDMRGDTVGTFESMTRFRFRPIEVRFVTALGRPLAVLNAPSGEYSLATGALVTTGSARLVSDTSGRRIVTQAVLYDVETNQLASDSSFTATFGARKLSGVGFTSDPGLFTIQCVAKCVGSLGAPPNAGPRSRPPAPRPRSAPVRTPVPAPPPP